MARHSPLLERIRSRLQNSPRGDLLRRGMRVFLEKGDLVLEGEVTDVADKKTALVQAAMVAGVGPIIDRLHVRPSARRSDAEILRDVRHLLAAEVALADCLVQGTACGNHSRTMVLCPEGWQGDIEIRVEDGVVTLDGEVPGLAQKCLASILAWSVPGCRDVIDGLGVDATDEDSDTAMTEAIRRAMERLSPSRGAPLTLRVTGGVVTLAGEVASWDEVRAIDRMIWGMFGVTEVRNQLAISGPDGDVDGRPPPEAVTGGGIRTAPKAL
jgi:osmotically-inducible protein OsmY